MSEKAKPVIFKKLEAKTVPLTWLDNSNAPPVRKLFQPEPEPAPPPRPETAPPPPPPPQPPPQAQQAKPQPAPQPTAAAPQPQPSAAADEPLLDERVLSHLPPPPKLGSLIPGARSAPPPANDTGYEHAEAFVSAAVELAIARTATLSVLEGQLLDLAIDIASALIEHEVEENPELHAALARAAISSLGDTDHVTLRTSPQAFDAICRSLGGKDATVRGVAVEVVADGTIPGLGCVVDGDNMRVDATVSERLRAVRRSFEEERRKVAENSE